MFQFSRNRNPLNGMEESMDIRGDGDEEFDDGVEAGGVNGGSSLPSWYGRDSTGGGGGASEGDTPLNQYSEAPDEEEGRTKNDGADDPKKELQVDSTGKENGDEMEENEDVEGENNSDEEHDDWNSFLATGKVEECPNLSDYLNAKKAREDAKEILLKALEECEAGIRKSMVDEMLSDTVVSIHQNQQEYSDAHEADIITTMVSNHERRKAMLKNIDDADAEWKKKYKRLRRNIEHEEEVPTEGTEQEEFGMEERQEKAADRGMIPGASQGEEPNWDELIEHEPSRESIESFLAARERVQTADGTLQLALDDIHAGLEREVQAIMTIALEIRDEEEAKCIALERDIEYHLMENQKRREILQERLEESAKKAAGVFATLLSRLGMKR